MSGVHTVNYDRVPPASTSCPVSCGRQLYIHEFERGHVGSRRSLNVDSAALND